MTELFPAGTFRPDPRPNTVPRMLAAQYGLELKLLLRNGEQLLLTMFIPITLLIGLTLLPLGSFGEHRVGEGRSDGKNNERERPPKSLLKGHADVHLEWRHAGSYVCKR